MKQLDGYRVRLLLVCLITLMVIGGGHAKADFTYGTPINLGPPLNTADSDGGAYISADGLSLFFSSARPGGFGGGDLYVVTRATIKDRWGPVENVGPMVNSSGDDWAPSISADGLELFFTAPGVRPGGIGMHDIWVTTRATPHEDWGEPVNLGPVVNSSENDGAPCISSDGLSLYFASLRSHGIGECDLWVTTRATKKDDWSKPDNLGPIVNTNCAEFGPSISPDGLTLFFDSGFGGGPPRPGGIGASDLWVTRRTGKNEPWGEPVNLGPIVNSTSDEIRPNISADGSILYFCSNREGGAGNNDVWQVPIIRIFDFNSDGIADIKDVVILTDHWGEDYPLCDIGPTPLGDGVVNIRDLIVLAEYLFEKVSDPSLVAYWALDETEGSIAYDSIGSHDGTLNGNPLWQPGGGKDGHALHFDGIDDYVSTPFILNPGKASFSVTAWICGGAPGQVIISQADIEGQNPVESGSTWLGVNPSDGGLMTGLMGIFFGSLESESVITDEHWHHVGLVYDFNTKKRHLYIDGAEVAVDTGFVGGVQSTAGLHIGAGQTLDAGTFFSGLIDDVRIYNKALTAEEIAALAL